MASCSSSFLSLVFFFFLYPQLGVVTCDRLKTVVVPKTIWKYNKKKFLADTLPLQRAKISQQALVRASEKATKVAKAARIVSEEAKRQADADAEAAEVARQAAG